MPAPETVTPVDLTGAPPLLADLGAALQLRLPAAKRERLAVIAARIPDGATGPTDIADEAYRWFTDEHVRRWLTAAGLGFDGFGQSSHVAHTLWQSVRRDLGAGWLTAYDQGADAVHRSCAGAVWPELRSYWSQAASGWDAAAYASRVVAAGKGRQTLEDVVGPEQDAALSLFERLVEALS